MVASWRGHLKTVMELLSSGALPNAQDEVCTCAELWKAVNVCVIVVVQVGLTSLILATQSGHTEVVKALLEANTEVQIAYCGMVYIYWHEHSHTHLCHFQEPEDSVIPEVIICRTSSPSRDIYTHFIHTTYMYTLTHVLCSVPRPIEHSGPL